MVAPAGALTDSTPPVVQGVTLAPPSVDVAAGPGTVTVLLRITDDLSGLSHGYLAWRSPSGTIAQYASIVAGMLSSGTVQDGVYLSSVTLPRFSEPGEWRPAYLFVRDVTGNVSRLGTASQLAAVPSLEVTDTSAGPPAPPARPRVVAGDRAVTGRWTPVRTSTGAPVTSYTVTASPGGATTTVPAPALASTAPLSAVVGGLVNGVGYTFTVRATSEAGTSAPGPVSAPARPRPRLTVSAGTVREPSTGTAMLPFTVSLSSPTTLPVTVTAATAPSTATAGADYTPVTVALTLPPGETSATVRVPVLGDDLHELLERVVVQLSEATNADLTVSRAAGAILDDDPAPQAWFSDAVVREGDSGITALTLTVTLLAVSGADASFSFAVQPSGGTATVGKDYLLASGRVVIPAGRISATFTVPVVGDTAWEWLETVPVWVSAPREVGLSPSLIRGTIVDDDQP